MPAMFRRTPDPLTCDAMHPPIRGTAVTDPIDTINPDGTGEVPPVIRASLVGRRPVIGAMLALLAPTVVPPSSVAADAAEPPVLLSRHLDVPIVLAPVTPPPTVVTARAVDPADYADAPTVRHILDTCELDLSEVPDVIGYIAEALLRHLGRGETCWPFLDDLNRSDAYLIALLRKTQAGEPMTDRELMLAVDDISSSAEAATYDAVWAGAALGFALGLTQPATIAGQADWTARALAVYGQQRLAERPDRVSAAETIQRTPANVPVGEPFPTTWITAAAAAMRDVEEGPLPDDVELIGPVNDPYQLLAWAGLTGAVEAGFPDAPNRPAAARVVEAQAT